MRMALKKRKLARVNPADYMEEEDRSRAGLAPEIEEVNDGEMMEEEIPEEEFEVTEEDGDAALEVEAKIPLKDENEIEKLKNAFMPGDEKRPGFMGKAAAKIKAALDKGR